MTVADVLEDLLQRHEAALELLDHLVWFIKVRLAEWQGQLAAQSETNASVRNAIGGVQKNLSRVESDDDISALPKWPRTRDAAV